MRFPGDRSISMHCARWSVEEIAHRKVEPVRDCACTNWRRALAQVLWGSGGAAIFGATHAPASSHETTRSNDKEGELRKRALAERCCAKGSESRRVDTGGDPKHSGAVDGGFNGRLGRA